MLRLKPISLRDANEYVRKHHRHHKPVAGHKFSIGCEADSELVGVIIAGRPVSRYLDDGFTLEVTAAALTTCNCKEKCAAGQVNTDCPVCKTNMSECTGTAPATPEPDIAAKCDKETMLQREYTPDCMDKRNRYMVDHADYILAVWNGCPSGTGNTVRYAHKKGKSIIVINPASLEVTQE